LLLPCFGDGDITFDGEVGHDLSVHGEFVDRVAFGNDGSRVERLDRRSLVRTCDRPRGGTVV
jgi:hypothetical protein